MLTTTTIRGNRAPVDHLEVRCDETDRLLGWIAGINAGLVPPDELLEFEADPEGLAIGGENGVNTQGLMTGIQVDELEVTFPRKNEMTALDRIHATVPEYAKRTRLPCGEMCVNTWTAAVVTLAEAEELFDFENFVPYGQEDLLLKADEALFHAHGKPAAPMPKAAPLTVSGLASLGEIAGTVPDLSKVLVGAKLPVSELGKTLNQLGVAAAKAAGEMQTAMDRAFAKARQGR